MWRGDVECCWWNYISDTLTTWVTPSALSDTDLQHCNNTVKCCDQILLFADLVLDPGVETTGWPLVMRAGHLSYLCLLLQCSSLAPISSLSPLLFLPTFSCFMITWSTVRQQLYQWWLNVPAKFQHCFKGKRSGKTWILVKALHKTQIFWRSQILVHVP